MRPLPLVFAAGLAAYLVLRRRRLGRTSLAAGAATVVVAALFGFGVIPVPDLVSLVERAGAALGPYTYLAVGILAFLETGAFVGLVAPGETAVLVAGVVAGQGEVDPVLLIGLVWACAVAGDLTSFTIGRRLGRDFLLRHGDRLKVTEARLVRVEDFLERRGGVTILVGRFIGVVRALAPFVAGAARMPLAKFVPYDVLGAGLWSATFVLLGYVFWRSLDTVERYVGRGLLGFAVLVGLLAGGLYARRLLRDADERGRAAAWLEDRPVLRGLVPLGRRALGPARSVADRLTPGAFSLELATLSALVAVGTFVFFTLGGELGDERPLLVGDARAADLAETLRTGWAERVVARFTDLGSLPATALLTTLTAVWATRRRHGARAAALVAGLALTWAAVHLAKAAEGRPRPPDGITDGVGLSYPSGHSAYAVALVACAVVLVRAGSSLAARFAAIGVAVVLAILIGLSRIYLRVHYLSDVLGGFALAAAVFAACGLVARIVDRVRHNGGS